MRIDVAIDLSLSFFQASRHWLSSGDLWRLMEVVVIVVVKIS